MLEHNPEFACILAFDVPVDREVQMLADKEGVRIFQANIIYHLEENFINYRCELIPFFKLTIFIKKRVGTQTSPGE